MKRLKNIFTGVLLAILVIFRNRVQATESYLYLKVKKENLRIAPHGNKIAEFFQSTKMEVLGEEDKWVEVLVTGWI